MKRSFNEPASFSKHRKKYSKVTKQKIMISKWFQLASYVSCINVSTNDEINYTTGLKKNRLFPKSTVLT